VLGWPDAHPRVQHLGHEGGAAHGQIRAQFVVPCRRPRGRFCSPFSFGALSGSFFEFMMHGSPGACGSNAGTARPVLVRHDVARWAPTARAAGVNRQGKATKNVAPIPPGA